MPGPEERSPAPTHTSRSAEFYWGWWDPQGTRFLISGVDTAVFDRSGTLEFVLPEEIVGQHTPWSPDGTRLVTAGFIWDVATGRRLACDAEAPWYEVAWHPGGARVAGACQGSGLAGVWDAGTGALVTRLAGRAVGSLAWSPDGRVVATGNHEYPVTLWDAHTGSVIAELGITSRGGSTWGLTWTQRLRACDGKVCIEWDPSTGQPVSSVPAPAWEPPGLVSRAGRIDPAARTLTQASGTVRALDVPRAWSQVCVDGSAALAATCADRAVLLWRVGASAAYASLTTDGSPTALAWNREASQLAVGTRRGRVHLIDADTGVVLATWDQPGWITDLVFSPDGTRVAAVGNNLLVWSTEGAEPLTYPQSTGCFSEPAWSPDGRYLAFGEYDGLGGCYVWDVLEGLTHRLRQPAAISCGAPGYITAAWGSTLVTGHLDGLEVWQPHPPFQKVGEAACLDAARGIGVVEFSPDARRFATNEHGLSIRDSATGRLLSQHRLPVTPDQIRWVDPETLLLAASYGVYTFDLATGDLVGMWAPKTVPGATP